MPDTSQKPFLLTLEPNTKASDEAELRREEQREQLILELVLHAHMLAATQVRIQLGTLRCAECGLEQPAGEPQLHAGTCRVGLVLGTIRELSRLVQGIEPAGDRGLHYFEPWRADGDRLEVNGESFYLQSADDSLRLEDLLPGSVRRIAATVNFCAGLATDVLEEKPLADYCGGAA